MENTQPSQPLFPHLPERRAGLEELAENLWWSWNPGVRMLFKAFDRQAWKVAAGRVSLHLMDTVVESNSPWNRAITARFYTGDPEQRLRQEIVLVIGGPAVLKTLGINHCLLFLNEGHATFVLLERIREHLQTGSEFAGGAFLDLSVPTIGFAGRFATYKRALLIFQDLERLKKNFKDRWRPIQLTTPSWSFCKTSSTCHAIP